MGELAQLPRWQQLKWRRWRRLQQLLARGFGGGAGRLGCTGPSPARGQDCWGGACKNLRGVRERSRVRGREVRGCGWLAGEAGRAGPEGLQGSRRALLSAARARALHPLSSPASWDDPHAGAQIRAGSTWSGSPHSSSFSSFLNCSAP